MVILVCFNRAAAQQLLWHNKERTLHYLPEGGDFTCVNGKLRFNRALYGGNSAFRVEAGDLPEFAMYLPGMGGNLKFGLARGNQSKWLIDSKYIKAIYRPGSMIYQIKDSLLQNGSITIAVLALYEQEGMVIKIEVEDVPKDLQMLCGYGGVTGQRFSRDGDIGADPESSFYLKPEYCKNNSFKIDGNIFSVSYSGQKSVSSDSSFVQSQSKKLSGVFPFSSQLKIADAAIQSSPLALVNSNESSTPLIVGTFSVDEKSASYLLIGNVSTDFLKGNLLILFERAEQTRRTVSERIKVHTPDEFINTLGGALSIAADAIWDSISYMHGAVAWRMRLPGWRGAYAADVLGWHDRAKKHFSSYALSQVTNPPSGPIVADTALHLARQLEKMGTSLFSRGYICRSPGGDFRPHHYDMNLVFADQLLNHFNWTGDTAYVKKMWPLLQRHLAWEKRNFDPDGDGLYDAYAAIWASDALQYSGGGVTHSSCYNYRTNATMGALAKMIGENSKPYEREADKIMLAVNHQLWMPKRGWYAEYKDLFGHQFIHPSAGLWTIYHAIDSRLPDAFQSYQCLRYVDNEIPHIPIRARELSDTTLYILSTTNWQPYQWSLNNVALAENLHTSLAYWQGGRPNEAYQLWKSSLVESMYMGGSPGNFQQLSFYDAVRGELYRDFADPIGMAARSLVEGLFGILPDLLNKQIVIRPGFPSSWAFASLSTPDIQFEFTSEHNIDSYTIIPAFDKLIRLKLLLNVKTTSIERITVNGKNANWKNVDSAIEGPIIEILCEPSEQYSVKIIWRGSRQDSATLKEFYARGSLLRLQFTHAIVQKVYDPQNILTNVKIAQNTLGARIVGEVGYKTAFVKLKQGAFTWWEPLNIEIKEAVEIIAPVQQRNNLIFQVKNNSSASIQGGLSVDDGSMIPINIASGGLSEENSYPSEKIVPGSNDVIFRWSDVTGLHSVKGNIINWSIDGRMESTLEPVNLTSYFNDKVTNIFKNQYLSPRPSVPTLQLPTQGIGEWTHPLLTATINDSGFRANAANNIFSLPQGFFFQTPSDSSRNNIAFASQWDNYPKQIRIPLSGSASHAYLLMTGSTNPMQSRMVNGAMIFVYKDNTRDTLLLRNPESWWPIEQDYYDDGFAFTVGAPRPPRIRLKTGEIMSDDAYAGKIIDGGAATVFDLPLKHHKTLKELKFETWTNDVVMGLMSVTLVR